MIETHLPKTTDMLHTLTLEQLHEMNEQITQMIQLKQPTLREGLKCEVKSAKLKGMTGVITKINRTKVKVMFPGTGNERNAIWNVPKDMIILK